MRSGERSAKFGTVVTGEVPSRYKHFWRHYQGWGLVSFERFMMSIAGYAHAGGLGG